MSDLEFFNPSEGGESYDPAAFERFKEKIKKNGAFMAAARQQEQKQKQKEDKLAKILLKFIQNNQKSGILMLAARMLEENIPASFILSIILLGNEELIADMKQEAGVDMARLANPETSSGSSAQPMPKPSEYSLSTNFGNASLPLKIKAEIDSWGNGIYETGSSIPFRILETALDSEGNLKKVVIDCSANVLDDYLASSGAPQISYDACFSFCEFSLKGIMNAYKKQIENQKELA